MESDENGVYDHSTEIIAENAANVEGSENMAEGNQLSILVGWLNEMMPHLHLPLETSEEQLRVCLADGTVLSFVLNKLSPDSVEMGASFEPGPASVMRFLAAMDDMGLPRFELSDLEKGNMGPVLQCLRSLRASFCLDDEGDMILDHSRKRWSMSTLDKFPGIDGDQRQCNSSDGKFQHDVTSEESALMHHLAHTFHNVLQLKEGGYTDVSDIKILEFVNSTCVDNASAKSLYSIVNRILDECVERKNGDVPHRVACLLRKIVPLIEKRTATQYQDFKNQNNLFRAREEKYKSRIKVLETLIAGMTEENQVVMSQLELMKTEKIKIEQKEKLEEQNALRLKAEKNHCDIEISTLKQELELTKRTYELNCLQLEEQIHENKVESQNKLKELELILTDSKKKIVELELFSESEFRRWKRKEHSYRSFIDHQLGVMQDLRVALKSTKHEVLETKLNYAKEFDCLGLKFKLLVDAAENNHVILAENRRLYNEIQDLKGNIRVYCRIRPFLPSQSKRRTIIEYVGENGELVVSNPLKQGKDSHRLFKFNKVFGPEASQEEVFLDTRSLIRSVLDGYNVCIFAYGQSGSGKTYTMSGPCKSSTEDWGVNYRALNDLFQICESRKGSIIYEVGVQMVEIYNEQVRDLLSSDGPQKRLGISNATLPNGLAVPEACMYSVRSTTDVLELMDVGLMNRAVCTTALNERSSRSHSVLTVHVRGMDLKSGATLRGNLHLIDLAGSERVDRSEATGDRLREAQHINKSLSALGDVIFALAQKNPHVPYRNSKLTQVLQSSLGGQAKTLMMVQLNPDVDSYSETLSTLKFAERVSGVELGVARSNKVGRDIRELMEQVACLKDIINKKDEEIERLHVIKANGNGARHGMCSMSHGHSPSSPGSHSVASLQATARSSTGKCMAPSDKAASNMDNCSEYSDKHSEAGSRWSLADTRDQKECPSSSRVSIGDLSQNVTEDSLGSEERLSDISDGGLGTETDGSPSIVELTLFPEHGKPAENSKNTKNLNARPSLPSKDPKPTPQKSVQKKPSRFLLTTGASSKTPASTRKPVVGGSSTAKTPRRWN